MNLKNKPESIIIVGSGAIGVEFAYFYNAIGTKVTIIEYQSNIVPNEDKDVSKELHKIFKKNGIEILTETAVEKAYVKDNSVHVETSTKDKKEVLTATKVLSAVGIVANIENVT